MTELERDDGFTVREALRTRQFWFISLGHGSALLVVSAVMVHLFTHLTESLGYTLTQGGRHQHRHPGLAGSGHDRRAACSAIA